MAMTSGPDHGPVPAGFYRIAAAALLVSLGAQDDELDPAFEILVRSGAVPQTQADVARLAREALGQVRAGLKSNPGTGEPGPGVTNPGRDHQYANPRNEG